MLFIDSSVRLKYDRQLEHGLEPKRDSNAYHSPWLAGVYESAHVCVHVRACVYVVQVLFQTYLLLLNIKLFPKK